MTAAAEAPDERTAVVETPMRKRRRLLPRFRLRTLFIAAVLMSLLLGWYGRHVYRVRQERAAVERLRQVGAQLTMPTFEYAGATLPADLYGLLPWFYVEEHASVALDSADGATDADLQHLGGLRGLRAVALRGEGFSDEGLRTAGDAKSLTDLNLRLTSITGDGLARFEGRERLTGLNFDSRDAPKPGRIHERIDELPNLAFVMTLSEPLTVEGMRATARLEHLRRFQANDPRWVESGAIIELSKARRLEELNIQSFTPPPIGDPELAAICEIESLQTLALPAPQLTDRGFARLADLPNLRDLFVIHCRNVGDAGVEALAEVETLERVSLSSCTLTDRSLDTLRKLPNLQWVLLPPGISREAAQRFADEHPHCKVEYPDPGSFAKRLEPRSAGGVAEPDDSPAD